MCTYSRRLLFHGLADGTRVQSLISLSEARARCDFGSQSFAIDLLGIWAPFDGRLEFECKLCILDPISTPKQTEAVCLAMLALPEWSY
jgi:hypothetical protein